MNHRHVISQKVIFHTPKLTILMSIALLKPQSNHTLNQV